MSTRALIVASLIALAAGCMFAGWLDRETRAGIHEREVRIAERGRELQRVRAIHVEVLQYIADKQDFQRQVDLMNQFLLERDPWRAPMEALRRIAAVPRVAIERAVIARELDVTLRTPEQARAVAAAMHGVADGTHVRMTFARPGADDDE